MLFRSKVPNSAFQFCLARPIMRARVVEAEAEVPKAMAAALREGKIGVMDYYQLKNLEADTSMREGIAKASAPVSAPRMNEGSGK